MRKWEEYTFFIKKNHLYSTIIALSSVSLLRALHMQTLEYKRLRQPSCLSPCGGPVFCIWACPQAFFLEPPPRQSWKAAERGQS